MPVTRSKHRRPRFLSWPGAAPTTITSSAIRADHFIEEVVDIPSSPKIPRPKNAFILFRNEWVQTHKKGSVHHCQDPDAPSLSRQAGTAWKALTASQRKPWEALAEKEKEEHARMYPHYRFRPVKRPSVKVATIHQTNHLHVTTSPNTGPMLVSESYDSTPNTPDSTVSEGHAESSFVQPINGNQGPTSSPLANRHALFYCEPQSSKLFAEAGRQTYSTDYYNPRYSLTPELSTDAGASEDIIPAPPALSDQPADGRAMRPLRSTISTTSSLAGWDGQVVDPSSRFSPSYLDSTLAIHERGYMSEPSTPWNFSHTYPDGLFDPCVASLTTPWQAAVTHYHQLTSMDTFSTLQLNPSDYGPPSLGGF